MSAHFLRSLRVPTGLAFLAVLGVAGCDDSAKVKQLEERIAGLETRITDLEAKQAVAVTYTKPDKEDEFIIATAGSMIDALLAGETTAVRGNLSARLTKAIKDQEFITDGVQEWVARWNANKQFSTYTVDKVVFSPNKDEAVLTGTLTRKESGPKGSFSITLVKDKDKNKYLIDAGSAKP